VVLRSLIAVSIDNSALERGRVMSAKRNVMPWMTHRNAEINQNAMTHMTIVTLSLIVKTTYTIAIKCGLVAVLSANHILMLMWLRSLLKH
jgi:hypothetical protein